MIPSGPPTAASGPEVPAIATPSAADPEEDLARIFLALTSPEVHDDFIAARAAAGASNGERTRDLSAIVLAGVAFIVGMALLAAWW